MSTLFSNAKLTFARISPITQIQRFLLSNKRQGILKRVTKEKLYTLQIQEEKLKKQLNHLNITWKQAQKTVDNEVQKLTNKTSNSQHVKLTDQNFILFIKTLEQTQDIEIRIEAISNVVEKIDGIKLQKSGNQVKHNIQSIVTYRNILDSYLSKLQTEMIYWKAQENLEEIRTQIETIVAEKEVA